MSSRDDFANLTYRWLQNDDLTKPERDFVVEYLLRYLKGQKTEDYRLPDIIDWQFTGDNIVFNNTELTVQTGYLTVGYEFEDLMPVGSLGAGGGGNTQTDCITVHGTDVYVGGDFSEIAGVTANGIAKYDMLTGEWSALASGITAVVDIVFDSNGILYVASTSTAEYNYLAQWDGSSWSAVGTGTNGSVRDIFIKDDILYVVGNFSSANGVSADNIASYDIDGDTWSYYGTSVFSGGVDTLYAVSVDSNDNIYVGGSFTSPASHITTWTGAAWSAMGSGFDDNIYSIFIDSNDKIYAGGSKNNTYNVQYWNASASIWVPMTGIDTTIFEMIGYTDGSVYAGGSFTTPTLDVSKWNGSAWITLQDTLTNAGSSSTSVTGMDIDTNGNLYITGYTRNSSNSVKYYSKKYSVPNSTSLLGYTAEYESYKSTDDQLSEDSDVLYPSQSAVRDYAPKKKITTSDPTADDDVTLDYRVGDIWINTT